MSTDTAKLIAQARERINDDLGLNAKQVFALCDALEAAEAEVEKAHAAMTHWLGKANDAEAELDEYKKIAGDEWVSTADLQEKVRRLREALEQVDRRLDDAETCEEIIRAALAESGE